VIKLGFKLYSFIAILSPWIFLALRLSGKYNWIGHNTAVFLFLFLISLITMFLCYKPEGK